MTPKQLALLLSLGAAVVVTVGGVLSVRDIYQPKPGVVLADLTDAGFANCPVRHGRIWVTDPAGRVLTKEYDGRVCSGDIAFCWSRTAQGGCNAPPAGFKVLRVRDLGAAAGGETDPVDVAPECGCQTDAGTCTATAPDAGTLRPLPAWKVAGPGYAWTSPSAQCQPMPCVETQAELEWPFQCPRR